ncbi:hypothetical protein LKMONMHP_0049 [Methylobacterium organophilum]|uniref:Diguanylate cyclase n=1 Tax=Methylobacterium organophilum TaxID=410 RepID=A0ABQ4T0Q3_METOR|nr:hypothetical protein LKMONMHP_0049 [Methylobacterium organophilum]
MPGPSRRSRSLPTSAGERIRLLEAQIRLQNAIIRAQAKELAHSRKTFDRASQAARIGVWECDLPSETLRWTDVVYDLFDMPRGSKVDRGRALACYTEESRRALTALRNRAIAERSGFSLDAEIVTAAGCRRWIRLTATVESEGGHAVRIFGMKQDITEEKILSDRTQYLANFDAMTGLANRHRFQARLHTPFHALILVDLDGFKGVNDNYGHAVGDVCLVETARRLSDLCGRVALVARIGGDEFALLLDGAPEDGLEALAARIVATLGQPIRHGGLSFHVGASVGVALAAREDPDSLFGQADAALYAAKNAGRNTYRFAPPAAAPAAGRHERRG